MFTGRTDVVAEAPTLWPPDAKSWLIWKDPDDGKDWGQEERGMTEDEMVRWQHLLNGHEFGRTPGVGNGQGGLMCCSSWGCKELDLTEQLNWTDGRESWTIKKAECRRIWLNWTEGHTCAPGIGNQVIHKMWDYSVCYSLHVIQSITWSVWLPQIRS